MVCSLCDKNKRPHLLGHTNPKISFFFFNLNEEKRSTSSSSKTVLQSHLRQKIQWSPYVNIWVPTSKSSSVACWFTRSGTIWLLHAGKTAIIKQFPHTGRPYTNHQLRNSTICVQELQLSIISQTTCHVTSNNCFVTLTVIVNSTSGIDVKWYRLYRFSFVLAFCIF